MNTLPRFMIAAAHKSSGKTVVSVGLASALAKAGTTVATFKKGPDYIDPMWLAKASGRPCYNLDFNTMERGSIAPFFATRAAGNQLSLIEANKGLFDGVDPGGCDSNAELAKLLGLPVILVIDTLGMTRGIAPLLMGYQAFDPDVNIAGVILNKVGGARHESKLRQAVETYSDLRIVGSVWRDPKLEIGERHLGLTTPAETAQMDGLIAGFADKLGASVDLDAVRHIANAAPELSAPIHSAPTRSDGKTGMRIGVIRDAAFGFYYPDDLQTFAELGAELVWISAIDDAQLPDIDGLFIGGGFPECRMQALSENVGMRASIRNALQAGLPCYAECGGLMYLCDSLSWQGQTQDMVGFINARAVMHDRPQGRGYVRFERDDRHPWGRAKSPVKAHEFHYASVEGLDPATTMARTMQRGHGIDGARDGIVSGNTLAGFCHLRHTDKTPWVADFLNFVVKTKTTHP